MQLHHYIKLLFLKKQTGVMVILLTWPSKVPHLAWLGYWQFHMVFLSLVW